QFARCPAFLQLSLYRLRRLALRLRLSGARGDAPQRPGRTLRRRIPADQEGLQLEDHAFRRSRPPGEGTSAALVDHFASFGQQRLGAAMNSVLRTSLFSTALLGFAAMAVPAMAQVSPDFANSKVVVVEQEAGDHGYWTTTFDTFDPDNKRKPIAEERKQIRLQMMERRVLEEYAEFLSPLRLPHTLKL